MFKDRFKDTGVKSLFIAAVVPKTPENNHNQRQLITALGMEGLEWACTTDLKMGSVLTGKSLGQPTYGCIYCNMPKPFLSDSYELLSLGDLVKLHESYVSAGSNKKNQARYQNFVNMNLLAGDPETLVMDCLNIPELHLLIGVVDQHLKGLEKVFGVEWLDDYLKRVNILRKSYQGGHALEGNQSSMFLKKLPVLTEEIMNQPDTLKIEGLALIESLRCFEKVQQCCFGNELNKDSYEDAIEKFSAAYRALEGIAITPKVHIVEKHVVDFLKRKQEQHGLGWWSEQAFEAMHSDMKKDWERVKINDPDHPDFAQRLLDFVIRYNARHV